MHIKSNQQKVKLPRPRYDGNMSIEKALSSRRSIRNYSYAPLSLTEISQLLWAAYGITSPGGLRAAPSAGALYPLEIYVVIGEVNGLTAGVYKYNCLKHTLHITGEQDIRSELSRAGLGQLSIKNAPVTLVICAVYERITGKYGNRGIRYAHMEAGHVSQNIYLQAVSLGLGTVAIGAFEDKQVKKIAAVQEDELPLYLMPVGK